MKALIERIVWQAPEGWTVMALQPLEGGDEITATGHLTSDITAGSTVQMTGEFTMHPRYGRQFRVDTIIPVMPSTSRGIEAWLASGAVGNVGKKMAKRIVEHFGDETGYIINNTPERIIEVEGIGEVRVRGLIEGLKGNQNTRQLIEWLGPHGVSMGMINKLLRAFRSPEETLHECHRNPYVSLSKTEVPFSVMDKVALADGMPNADPRRLNAVAVHEIKKYMREGHCYIRDGELKKRMVGYLCFPVESLDWADGSLAVEEFGTYVKYVRRQEEAVDEWLRDASREDKLFVSEEQADVAVDKAFAECGVEPSEKQREAVQGVTKYRILVITGGPGTGKTTIVNAINRLAENRDLSTRLLAPTGRAQLKLGEVCGREASTIHKALMFQDGAGRWNEDVVIIDEVSMVDIELMSRTVRAMSKGARLVLVGDYHQLPSVGPGNVLKDIIDSDVVPVVRLDVIFRQAQESEIIMNSHRIIAGREIEGPEGGDCWLDYWPVREGEEAADYGERMEDRIVQVVTEMCPDFNPMTEIQVLLPMYKHHPSINAINEKLQARLNPPSPKRPELTWGTWVVRVGDKVMQTKNNYSLGVFNGEIGIVMDASQKPKKLMVEYPGMRLCEYDVETIPELKHAYAVSIHKSQGSEYPCVVLGFSKSHWIMLQRNLIYTALTRAKKKCIIIGDKVAVQRAIDNDQPIYRNTRLLKNGTY